MSLESPDGRAKLGDGYGKIKCHGCQTVADETYAHIINNTVVLCIECAEQVFHLYKSAFHYGGDGRSTSSGDVYLAQSETGHYKIGWSTDAPERVEHFDTQMPVEVDLVHSFTADRARDAESRLHDWASNHHVKGEWFEFSNSQVSVLKNTTEYSDGTFYQYDGQPLNNTLKRVLG